MPLSSRSGSPAKRRGRLPWSRSGGAVVRTDLATAFRRSSSARVAMASAESDRSGGDAGASASDGPDRGERMTDEITHLGEDEMRRFGQSWANNPGLGKMRELIVSYARSQGGLDARLLGTRRWALLREANPHAHGSNRRRARRRGVGARTDLQGDLGVGQATPRCRSGLPAARWTSGQPL